MSDTVRWRSLVIDESPEEPQVGGLGRFVHAHLEDFLARHRIHLHPDAAAELRLLQEAVLELERPAAGEVIHVAWPTRDASLPRAA